MRIIETVGELQALSLGWRAAGHSVGMVPTMGALHQGHLSLVRAARSGTDRVIVSIFVNPTQFTDEADLGAYPRTFEADAAMLGAVGVDAVFHPSVGEMYPDGAEAILVRPARVANLYEGEQRPGHFEGVATVVARLFNAGLPDRAYFGRKDAQQLAVIRALVRDLALPIEVMGCPTVREVDGLAMSSRNSRLDPISRVRSAALVRALAAAQRAYAGGTRDLATIGTAVTGALHGSPGLEVEYAAVVDPVTFRPPKTATAGSLVVIAARVGGVRLIDNAELGAGDLLWLGAAPAAIETPMAPASTNPPHGVPA